MYKPILHSRKGVIPYDFSFSCQFPVFQYRIRDKEFIYKPYKCNCSCQTSCGDAISDAFNGLPNVLGGKCINQSHIQERESIYIPYDFSCSCQFQAVEVNKKTISNLRMSSSTNLMIAFCSCQYAFGEAIPAASNCFFFQRHSEADQPTNATTKHMSSRDKGQPTGIHQRKDVLADAIRCL